MLTTANYIITTLTSTRKRWDRQTDGHYTVALCFLQCIWLAKTKYNVCRAVKKAEHTGTMDYATLRY